MTEYKCSAAAREAARVRSEARRRMNGVQKKVGMPERFWSKTEQVTESGCIIWLAYSTKNGYGQVGVGGKVLRAHRVAWELANGSIPEGSDVLHKCDTPSCVNPAHLMLGSQTKNMADMVLKNRDAIGEKHGNAKLRLNSVIDILESTNGPSELAKKHGVSPSTVCDIRAGRSWVRAASGSPKLTPEAIEQLALIQSGEA